MSNSIREKYPTPVFKTKRPSLYDYLSKNKTNTVSAQKLKNSIRHGNPKILADFIIKTLAEEKRDISDAKIFSSKLSEIIKVLEKQELKNTIEKNAIALKEREDFKNVAQGR